MVKESKMLVTLKSGAQKWMTKHELKQHNKRLDSLKELYIKYINEGIISPDSDKMTVVRQMIDEGVKLMYAIGHIADLITVTGYNRVKNEVNHMIPKKDFVEIVKFVAYHDKEKIKNFDDSKLTKKLFKEIDESLFKINFKRTFYSQYINFDEFSTSESPKNVIFPKLDYIKNNSRFKEIVNSCAKSRIYLDEQLWPQYKEYADIAEFASDGDLTYDRYKKLVDYNYYTGDEDPRFQGQDKRWEKLLDTFLYNYKLCKTYGYEFFGPVEAEVLKHYNNIA